MNTHCVCVLFVAAELTFNVRRVFLTANLLTSVGRALQFSQMTEVALADNLIAALLESDLQGAHGVQALELQGNRIAGVDEAALAPVRRDLVHLDLSRNRLRRLGGCVRFLSALVSLNLTDNLLEVRLVSSPGLNSRTAQFVLVLLQPFLSSGVELWPSVR